MCKKIYQKKKILSLGAKHLYCMLLHDPIGSAKIGSTAKQLWNIKGTLGE